MHVAFSSDNANMVHLDPRHDMVFLDMGPIFFISYGLSVYYVFMGLLAGLHVKQNLQKKCIYWIFQFFEIIVKLKVE